MHSRATKAPKLFTRLTQPPNWLVWLFCFLVLYVLSTGPIYLLEVYQPLPQPLAITVDCVYAPLTWLHNNSTSCNDAIEWYIETVWRTKVQ